MNRKIHASIIMVSEKECSKKYLSALFILQRAVHIIIYILTGTIGAPKFTPEWMCSVLYLVMISSMLERK